MTEKIKQNRQAHKRYTSYDKFLADKLRDIRVSNRYFLTAIAKKTKISVHALTNFEHYSVRITAANLYRISKALQIDINQFFEGIELIEDNIDEINKKNQEE